MFEYKVRAKHKLGYKEFIFYADTDIEEFLNRNDIKYVRNMTDTIEHKQLQEIERLNSIIKEVRECINHYAIENEDYSKIYNDEEKELLEILDKESK